MSKFLQMTDALAVNVDQVTTIKLSNCKMFCIMSTGEKLEFAYESDKDRNVKYRELTKLKIEDPPEPEPEKEAETAEKEHAGAA